jgi:rRNA maturation protein Nop10
MPLLAKNKDGTYTLSKINTINPHPPKFNPTDKNGKYRRLARKSADV